MFETLEQLNKTLPRPRINGDSAHDRQVVERYIANGRALRHEAFACIGRSLAGAISRFWHRMTRPRSTSLSPQA